MHSLDLPATITEVPLGSAPPMNAAVVVPTVRSTWKLKYGAHAYYCFNFRTAQGFVVDLSHLDIVRPGWRRFQRAATGKEGFRALPGCLLRRYHYGFSLLEQLMLMTVPHTVTDVGNGRFLVNLWSYYGYLLVDCRARTVTYRLLEEQGEDHVLGSSQWYDSGTDRLYTLSYSLSESFARLSDPARAVSARLFRHALDSSDTEPVWSGSLADFLHEIVVSQDRRHLVVCELGMYLDSNLALIPSRVLIVGLGTGRQPQWRLDRFVVAAHAQFDPEDPEVIYFSNHNFQFEHTPLLRLLKHATYAVKFRGPASIFKYRLTAEGPREIGAFTRDDFYRLTNMRVFTHRGRKLIAATGFPDEIFLVDAETMRLADRIRVKEPRTSHREQQAMIGTMTPSPDGARLFVQTTASFQVLDITGGRAEYVYENGRHHSCANHMLAFTHTDWGT